MQEDGLQARARKRFKCTTMSDHDQPVAANLLDRDFTAEAPNRRWVGDTTEFVIATAGSCTSRPSSTCSPGSSSAGPSAR
jgi:transposase InsO family protein